MPISRVLPSRRRLIIKIVGVLMSIIASVIWGATIITLFIRWGLEGFIPFDSDDGEVAYISNVGAQFSTGFMLGTAVTGTAYFLTLLFTKLYFDLKIVERFKRIVSIVMILFGAIAGLSLILLSVLDSIHHKRAHYTFVGLFIVFILLAAVLSVVYRYEKDEFNWIMGLRVLIIGLIIPLIITFVVLAPIGGTSDRTNLKSSAASIEWSIALLLVIDFALFGLDILIDK